MKGSDVSDKVFKEKVHSLFQGPGRPSDPLVTKNLAAMITSSITNPYQSVTLAFGGSYTFQVSSSTRNLCLIVRFSVPADTVPDQFRYRCEYILLIKRIMSITSIIDENKGFELKNIEVKTAKNRNTSRKNVELQKY